MKVESALQLLNSEIVACRRCPLFRTRKNAVPGEGHPYARIMFVGEAPGAMEDKTGRPFVGRSGLLLTELLSEIGLSRKGVYITSILKSRPPKNRPPHRNEIAACLPFLKRQISIINPEIIVLLGSTAISSIVGPWNLSDAHGKFFECGARKYFMTYHPAAALRATRIAKTMHSDFRILKEELEMRGS